MPTLLDASGTATPDGLDGISFLPTLLGRGDQTQHEYLVWHFPAYGGQQAARVGNWKGVRQNRLRANISPLELYDLSDDPGESHNVAAQHPDIVNQMVEILEESQRPCEYFPILP